MRKLFIKSTLIVVLVALLFCSYSVSAKNIYYTNANGIEMSELEYDKLLQIFSETKIKYLTEEEFETYKDVNILMSDSIYQRVVSLNGEIISEEEVSEEEYNNASTSESTPGIMRSVDDYGFYETTYKKLGISLSEGNGILLTGTLSWKLVPYCRSYDVFAYRFNHFDYSGFSGSQVYVKSNGAYNINYNTSSAGYKALSNGAGVSMNLKDDSDITGFELTVLTHIAFNSSDYSQGHVYISYQHAQADVTRAQSMDYTLNISGYGNVVLFSDSSIANKYDQMSGIHLVVPYE